MTAKANIAGGLVGQIEGGQSGATIKNSYATGPVSGLSAGGLVGGGSGIITGSYATGSVTATVYKSGYIPVGGGLIGEQTPGSSIINSYATGAVTGPANSNVGGLLGINVGAVGTSYSTGAVTAGTGSLIGGLIGNDESSSGSVTDSYWDVDTSGITDLSQGAGNIPNDPGITGLTTEQFQSGLPPGFDPKVWAENSNINGGLPYLVGNPPAKKR